MLALHELCRSFGSLEALRSVSLELPDGTITVVLGLNGSGKTTLLRLMAGALAPTSGEVRLDGERLTRNRLDLRRRVMFIAETPLVLPESPVIAWIGTCLRAYGVERPGLEADVSQVLRDLEMAPFAGMPLATLSRGQVYKAALAALIAVDPEVWLLDEPFASGMDPTGLAVLLEALRAAAARGRTVVLGTQMLELAGRIAHRAIVLREGCVVACGGVEALVAGHESLERVFRDLSGARA